MHKSNTSLVHAFPQSVRDDALLAASAFPDGHQSPDGFSVKIAGQAVTIPYRIYHDRSRISALSLDGLQMHLVDCLLTRHNDGYVRHEHLRRIITRKHAWVPPFVLQLAGEYVVEILETIRHNLEALDHAIYAAFVRDNPEFLAITEQRIISYWDCYYRGTRREEYVGFQVVEFMKALGGNGE